MAAIDERFVFAGGLAAVSSNVAFLSAWTFITGRRRTPRVLIVAIVAACITPMFVPALASSMEAGRRNQCINNLRQVGFALAAYHQTQGHFPPAYLADGNGKPLLSWRLLIFPYLEQSLELYSSFDLSKPWDGADNIRQSQTSIMVYRCPGGSQPPAMTEYLAVVGPNAAWPGATGSKLADFKDPKKTILVVEVANSGINWAEPRDLSIEKITRGIPSNHTGGFNALFADGHVEFIPDDIDPKKLAEMFEFNPRNAGSK